MRGGKRFFRSGSVLLLMAGVILLSGCDQLLNLGKDPGTIQGMIRNGSTNNLLTVIVNVNADDGTSTSTSNGTYRLESVESGSRTVNFSAQGFQDYSRTINVGSGETVTLDVYMQPLTGAIQGTIRDGATSETITVEVHINADDGSSAVTNNGTYHLENVQIGSRMVIFTAEGFQEYSQTVNVIAGQSATLNVFMQPVTSGTGSISGSIFQAGTSNLIMASVTVSTDDSQSTTTSDGSYVLNNVQAGVRTVTATADGYETYSSSVQVVADQNVNLPINLIPSTAQTGEVKGYVRDVDTNDPLAGADVWTEMNGSTVTNSEGWYSLNLLPGDYNITAGYSGYENQMQEVHVYANISVTLDFNLSSSVSNTATITGSVLDDSNSNPIGGASVSSDDGAQTYTDYNGYYTLIVGEGNRTITATAVDYSSSSVQFYLQGGQEIQYDFRLAPVGGDLALVVGYVSDFQSGNPISDVSVSSDDGSSSMTDSNGMFTFDVNAGYRVFYASVAGYYDGSGEAYCYSNTTNYVFIQLQPVATGNGWVAGYLTNAVDSNPLSGVSISSDDGASTTSNEYGYFEMEVVAGQRIISFTLNEFYDTSQEVYVESDTWSYVYVSLSPVLNPGEGAYRFVLSWGEQPYDLDSHLFIPPINEIPYHVWYGGRGEVTDPPYATLDVDDTNGYGPETITIYQMVDGTYAYYVHNYSGYPDIAGSGATVSIYNENGLVQQVTVPSSGDGTWWRVCTIDGIYVTIYNEVQVDMPSEWTTVSTSRGPVLSSKHKR
ncbi:MAG: carboxypeptidase regulatory-like domain-containing protein [bacterium]